MRFLWNGCGPSSGCIAAFSFFINVLFWSPRSSCCRCSIASSQPEPGNLHRASRRHRGGPADPPLLDYVRNRLQNVLGNIIDERLSPPVVAPPIVAKAAGAPKSVKAEGIRRHRRPPNVFSANALIALFDAPWVVAYVW